MELASRHQMRRFIIAIWIQIDPKGNILYGDFHFLEKCRKQKWTICRPKMSKFYVVSENSEIEVIQPTNRIDFILDESKTFDGTFRAAIWPILFIGQMYGAMPVIGISSQSLSDLHFKLKSFRTIFAVIVAIILSSYSLFSLWKIFTDAVAFNISEWEVII